MSVKQETTKTNQAGLGLDRPYRMLSGITKLFQKQSLLLILEIINLRSHHILTHIRVRIWVHVHVHIRSVHAVSVHSPGITTTRVKVRLVTGRVAVHGVLAWVSASCVSFFLRQRRKVHRVRSRSIDEVEVSVVVRVNMRSLAVFLSPSLFAWFWLEMRVDAILMS